MTRRDYLKSEGSLSSNLGRKEAAKLSRAIPEHFWMCAHEIEVFEETGIAKGKFGRSDINDFLTFLFAS